MITLSRLFVYPIKSTAPLELVSAEVLAEGLAHDRRYVVTDDKGRFLTARRFPRMVLIHTELSDDGLTVSAPGAPDLALATGSFESAYEPIRVWKDTVEAQRCGAGADSWFSEFLGIRCRLYFMGAKSYRASRAGGVVSFADAAPLLILSESSIDHLNARLQSPVEVRNFRPNLLVAGCAPYAEDDWGEFRLGDVVFKPLWRCSRCILTTVDPDAGTRADSGEPFATLMKHRRGDDGETYFGINVAAVNTGRIHVGQTLDFG